jgi:excisionase family DNA binding protein
MIQREAITMKELLEEYLPIHKDTAYRLAAEGKIPHVRCGHRMIFYRRSIEAWLANGGT